MGIEVKIIDPVVLFDAAHDMLATNWAESKEYSGVSMVFNPGDTRAFYDRLDAANLLVSLAVYDESQLVGCSYLTFVPHPLNASYKICNVDNIYILPEYRGGRAFSLLLDKIETIVKDHQANLLQFHAPFGSPFAKTLAMRFAPLSEYFYKEFEYNLPSKAEQRALVSSSANSIAAVSAAETVARTMPQVPLHTDHIIHAGMYARTITMPKDTIITGALIKCATMIIINGNVLVTLGDDTENLVGYHVVPASANRKQAYFANEETQLTMIFATDADNIEDAENQFTDEANLLMSRFSPNTNQITITGE